MPRFLNVVVCGAFLLLAFAAQCAHAETGAEAWLRYAPVDARAAQKYASLPASVVTLGDSPVLASAKNELIRGVRGILGRTLRDDKTLPQENAIILGTLRSLRTLAPEIAGGTALRDDGFLLSAEKVHGFDCLIIAAANDRGVLYGVFALLSKIARGENVSPLRETQQPSAPIRWADEWGNLDGHIERGYAGPSIFFENGGVRADLTRAGEYARLLASIGINGCAINNVNANPRVLEDSFLPQLARVADVFRPWGVQLSISVDFSSPKTIGGLDSFDPADPRVAEWWAKKVDEIYRQIPDF
ncbi:MAG: alpha-glucuronidase family glycosyl hydrolase, partial [Candidatus Acidiferrum sp.]